MIKRDRNPCPCFVCGGVLPAADPQYPPQNQPVGGIALRTVGNYGSRILDGDKIIEFAICDSCLVRNFARTREIHIETTQPVVTEVRRAGLVDPEVR